MIASLLFPPDARRLQRRLLLLLLGVTLAVFGGVCGHEFVHFDDNVNIYNNPHIQGLTAENLQWMFSNTTYARRYMPLGWLSYAVDYQLFGLNPQAYHVGNLLAHLLNVALLFFLLLRLLRLARGPAVDTPESLVTCPMDAPPGEAERGRLVREFDPSGFARTSRPRSVSLTILPDTAPVWCAALGALFWAVNPLRVENVAWASSRIYCVAFAFTMLWLLAWLKARDPETAPARRWFFYWGSVAAYAASVLTYPLAMFAPVALFVLEVYPLRQIGPRVRDWRGPGAARVWLDKLPFGVVAVSVLALTFFSLVNTDARHAPLTMAEFPPLSRAMQALYIWGYYLWKPWVPYDLAISYMTLHSFNPLGPRFLASAALVVAVSLALFHGRRRWPAALALWLCHLVLLVPVLGLTESPHSAYDRYSYLPGVLWSVGLAFLLRALWHQGKRGFLAGGALAVASLLFALPAWQQATVWRDTIPLYQHLLAHIGEHPDRSRFDVVLGVHYSRAGLTNEAIASFQNAVHYELRRPNRLLFDEGVLTSAHTHLGSIASAQGQFEEALVHYQAAVAADRESAPALLGCGSTLARLQRLDEALPFLREAVRVRPDSAPAHHELAVVLKKTGHESEAQQHFEEERRLQRERQLLAGK